MRKNCFLMATMMFVAMSMIFASCKKEKTDDPKDPTDIPLVYTLTVLSSNEEMGTVTGGGSYEEGTEVTLTAIFDYTVVDLGLPSGLKWAACNVGATKPEEYGNYYAWGETEPKTTYSWATYKWCNGSYDTLTKYNTSSSYGTVDNKTVLDPEDDAARTNWGGAWRMPTDAEWTELRENCEWTLTSDYNGTGVNGRVVTSKTNGNHIFLPAAGYRSNDDLYRAGNDGYYWSSSLDAGDPYGAWGVDFGSDFVGRYSYGRYCGQSVRPVL